MLALFSVVSALSEVEKMIAQEKKVSKKRNIYNFFVYFCAILSPIFEFFVQNVYFTENLNSKRKNMMENKAREVFYSKKNLDIFQPSDKQELMELAENGNIHAIFCLIRGLSLKERSFEETFIDEDTGEQITVPRCDVEEGVTFEKEEAEEGKEDEMTRLANMLYGAKERMSEEELCLSFRLPIDSDPLRLELVNRGNEEYAEDINDYGILLELIEKGNKHAALAAALKRQYGDEEQDVFIDLKEAKRLYGIAGVEMESDDDDNEEIYEYDYVLKSDTPDALNAVKTLIEDLADRYGPPTKEFGLYVPLDILMRVLVGSPYYHGNVMSMDAEAPNQIKLHVETDRIEPLLYALSTCFPHLDIEARDGCFTKTIKGCPSKEIPSRVHGELPK